MVLDVLEIIEVERDALEVPAFSAEELSIRLRALANNGSFEVSEFLDCAQAFESLGMLDKAFEACSGAIARDARSAAALLRRAEVGFALCLTEDDVVNRNKVATHAVEDFEAVISLSNGTSLPAMRGLACSLLILERYMDCEALLKQRGEADNEADGVFLLAFCQLFSGAACAALETVQLLEAVNSTEAVFVRGVCAVVNGVPEEISECTASLVHRRSGLAKSLQWLERSGCRRFIDVARALFS